ncbi:MAG: hypothetical protein DRR06_16080 [Gammaproteobacteria bacterium]|nr:MAG: hypothetical protein DRR06_16080 [Gammaproteobacteria bacterium]
MITGLVGGLFISLPGAVPLYADGSIIDKVYHPYVQLLEKEIEYRLRYQDDDDPELDDQQRHKLGLGQSLSDRVFAEIYLIGKNTPDSDFELSAVEAELKLQLTEQGEYNNDWGMLFELEREKDENIWEASTALIALHEWSRWIGTANLSLAYEWGNDIDNELETGLATQLRYRYSQAVEPALEVYFSEDTQGLGPVLTGVQRLGGRRKLLWEFGVILGLDNSTADASWKFNIEYEY